MKKCAKVVALLTALCMMFAVQASAQSVFMTGYTEPTAKGVTILVLKSDKEIKDITGDDIAWVDQQSINPDGSFVISLPLFTQEEYVVRSNALAITKAEDKNLTLYVSETGSGYGFDSEDPTTLAKAYEMLDTMNSVTAIAIEDITYAEASKEYAGNIKIKGLTGNENLTISTYLSLKGNLTLDNLVINAQKPIYACGKELVVTDTVTSTSDITVYGGSGGAALSTNTSLKLYGGSYKYIYGGSYNSELNGNTNVILGGNANIGHSTGDSGICFVYGGGYLGNVTGSTNVTLEGNAKAKYIVGAGRDAGGTATDTNINISGGNVMNVYAGARNTELTNCNTHINMTGGTAESLYGGSESASLTGNTYITVKGGEVTRRIYGGCYNNADALFSVSWADTDYHVTGTTNIMIYPDAKIATGTGLSWDNKVNMGLFGGSRKAADSTDEYGTIMFLDGSYSTLGSKVGEKGSSFTSSFKSFHEYIVNSAAGGTVLPDVPAGTVTVSLPQGKSALSNGKRYFDAAKIPLTEDAVTEIKYDGITSAQVTENTGSVDSTVGVDSSTAGELYAAIYDESGMLVSCGLTSINTTTKSYNINVDCKLEQNKKYVVRFFLWEDRVKLVPITTVYTIELR